VPTAVKELVRSAARRSEGDLMLIDAMTTFEI